MYFFQAVISKWEFSAAKCERMNWERRVVTEYVPWLRRRNGVSMPEQEAEGPKQVHIARSRSLRRRHR